jgi:hypothetical protein
MWCARCQQPKQHTTQKHLANCEHLNPHILPILFSFFSMVNYGNRRRADLERYRQEFYAHNRAAQHLANNLEPTCNLEQQRHASFEQAATGHLSVSTAYYTVSDSSKRCREEDTVVDYSTVNEVDYSDFQAITDDYLSEISEEPIRRKRTAGVLSLHESFV